VAELSTYHLRGIENQISQLASATVAIDNRVGHVQAQQAELDGKLEALVREFRAFIAADLKAKELQLAETRVVKVRQELETTFGHYGEVRRRATGILQAVDARIVTHETIQTTTEDVMLRTPRYWLAPALVALAAWTRNDRELASRALDEALARDADKTALFYALVLRRLGRLEAVGRWLAFFFSRQDPTALKREFVLILDAVATGGFGLPAKAHVGAQIAQWLHDLETRAGFTDAQRDRWQATFASFTPQPDDSAYPHLANYSPTWPQLKASLGAVQRNGVLIDHFNGIFEGELHLPRTVEQQVDELLDSLVSRFDVEELPLREQEALLQAVIDERGDVELAKKRFESTQTALEEEVDFPTLLTNAAMHAEEAGASRGTQRLAVALSKDWILSAHDALTLATRNAAAAQIELTIQDWNGTIQDGTNTDSLESGLGAHMDKRTEAAVAAVKFGAGPITAAVAAGALIIGTVAWGPAALVIGLIIAIYPFLEWKNLDKRRDAARAQGEQAKANALQELRGCIAETVDYRDEWKRQDARAEEARELIDSISPSDYSLTRDEEARTVVA
jgi:hypothetical protein